MQPSPFKYLPLVVVATALSGALLFYTKKESVRNKVNSLLSQTNPQITARLEPTPRSAQREDPSEALAKGGTPTPAAGHKPVDTALDPSIFYSLAGITYLSGLATFIKAKHT